MLEATVLGPDISPGLLAARRRLGESSSSRSARQPTRVVSPTNLADEGSSDEELVWFDSTVVWSRGCEIYRQLSFDHEDEEVSFALFAPFRLGDDPPAASTRKGKEKEGIKDPKKDTFGPFHVAHTAVWELLQNPSATTASRLDRALVVFLRTRAHVFLTTGEQGIVHLPFAVEKAWPMASGGMIVQRKLEGREMRGMKRKADELLYGLHQDVENTSILDTIVDMATDNEELPVLWTLERPFEELKMVTEASSAASPLPVTTDVLYVGQGACPIVVARDTAFNRLVFFRRQAADHPSPPTTSPVIPARLSPEDTMRHPEPMSRRSRPSLVRTSSTSLATSAAEERRLSGKADPLEREARRGPRLSRGAALEKDSLPSSAADELHATLEPPPFAMTVNKPAPRNRPRGVSASSSLAPDIGDRRASGAFMRDEPAPTGNRALFAIAEKDLRETTMLMGIERQDEAVRSNVAFATLHSWKCPPEMAAISMRVFASDEDWPESICINVHAGHRLFTFLVKTNSATLIRDVDATSAAPVLSTRPHVHDTLVLAEGALRIITSAGQSIPVCLPQQAVDGRDEVARRMASSLSMHMDADDPMSASHDGRRIIDISHSSGSRATLVYDDDESVRISINYQITDRLVRQCLDVLSGVLSESSLFHLKRELLNRARSPSTTTKQEHWNTFADTLRDMFALSPSRKPATAFGQLLDGTQKGNSLHARLLAARRVAVADTPIRGASRPAAQIHAVRLDITEMPHVMLALHMIGQESRCVAARQHEITLLGPLMLEMSAHLGLAVWWDYWRRLVHVPESQPPSTESTDPTVIVPLEGFETPPDIIAYLTRTLSYKTEPPPMVASPTATSNAIDRLGHDRPHPLPELHRLRHIYDCISSSSKHEALIRARAAVHWMAHSGLSMEWMHSLSFAVAMPIWEMVRICQSNPFPSWTALEYSFIGRTDLVAKLKGEDEVEDEYDEPEEQLPTIGQIIKGVTPDAKAPIQTAAVHSRFGSDRRVAEVERIMQVTRVRTIRIDDPAGASEQDILAFQQTMVSTIASRTLSIPVGNGIFEYATRKTAVTDVCRIPMIELSVKVLPRNTVLKAALPAENADWPCFHHGVSTALALAPECRGIDSSWIVSNKPNNLTAEHGGFLLGLGLNGHLRALKSYHAFPYMEPRHEYISSGLLLGLGASYCGSRDPLSTKVLSLHTHALLPPGSAELNASTMVQSTALVGLGLIHAGSRDLRMAELALGEVGRRQLSGVDNFEAHQEAYSFSASMAFGLVMLGRGAQPTSEIDRRLLAKVRRCILGDAGQGHQAQHSIDTTLTSPGATLALGLMYLKTGDRNASDILEIPQNALDADNVRPDLMLLRVLARSLIMWDEVEPSMYFIDAQLPTYIKDAINVEKQVPLDVGIELAFFHIVAGSCLAIGLKYAGTASEVAHTTLLSMYGQLSKSCARPNMGYEDKIRRHGARQCLNIITLALGTVMSGTGELQVLRRLRVSHGQEGAGVSYGTHMATHMALGLLFLGRGHYTLGTSNLAIAALCISFFPRFQAAPSDNKAYPQAFRHLWALAVEPRCLAAKDVDTKRTIYLPISVKVKDGDKARLQSLISPTLVMPFEHISGIDVDTPRYWRIGYDLADSKDRETLVRTRTMWVKRKPPFLDYKADPKGNRSMVTRAMSLTGWDLFYDLLSAATPPMQAAAELDSIIASHAPSPDLIASKRLYSGNSKFEKFIRNVVLECISLDKAHIVSVYTQIWLALYGQPSLELDTNAQFTLLDTFYSPFKHTQITMPLSGFDRAMGWIRPNFLHAAIREIRSSVVADKAVAAYFAHELWTPEVGVYIANNHVPPLVFLRAVRDLVRASPSTPLLDLQGKVRDAARIYAETLDRQYDAPDTDQPAEAKVWKVESVRRAIAVWLDLRPPWEREEESGVAP